MVEDMKDTPAVAAAKFGLGHFWGKGGVRLGYAGADCCPLEGATCRAT